MQTELNLDVARRCMLVERVAEVFNSIPTLDPVQRVMQIAKGVMQASQSNEAIKTMVVDSRFLEQLHAEAKRRKTGEVVFPPPLAGAAASDVSESREAQRV